MKLTLMDKDGRSISTIETNPIQSITLEYLNDILDAAACECGYWGEVECSQFREDSTEGSWITVREYPVEGGSGDLHKVQLRDLLWGFCMRLEQVGIRLLEDYDAVDADCILQLAVLGEIVYG